MNAAAAALTSALVQFTWQGSLAALALAAALHAARRRSPQVRYAMSAAALAVLIALPIAATVRGYAAARATPSDAPPAVQRPSSTSSDTTAPVTAAPSRPASAPILIRLEPWVLPAWSLGVLLLSVRLVVGGREAHALRRTSQAADGEVASMVSRLARQLGISRCVRIATSTFTDGPSVIGWLRPLILLPPAAAAGLTVGQLEAVIAHELAHIRRHDYLVNLVQMAAETLLFYHPAVWWVSRQMRLERELCCDDAAVGVCGDAAVYARALVLVARQQLPAMAVGAGGGSLSERVRRLLGAGGRETSGARAFGVVALALAFVGLGMAVAGTVQAGTGPLGAHAPLPRFAVVSIKPTPAEARGYRGVEFLPGGTVRGTNVPIFLMIVGAYDLSWKQLDSVSVSGDLLNERYDIEARADAGALPETGSTSAARQQVVREMFKALLAERFKLALHTERRDSPVYELRAGPTGSRLTPAKDDRVCTPGPCQTVGGGPASGLIGFKATVSDLANTLSVFLDRQVLDRTGITGVYDIDLPSWSNTARTTRSDNPNQEPEPDPDDPSIFTVLQERLGLRLVSARAPLDIYVIDHVERPAGN